MPVDRRRVARRRYFQPGESPLRDVIDAHAAISEAEHRRDNAILAALEAGWTMAEVGEAIGLSASTVCRIANRREEEQRIAELFMQKADA